MGKLANEDLVVTPTLNCVLVLKKEKHERLNMCLRCGKCADVCPVGLIPVLIKDHLNNVDELKKLCPEKCISCGLCSYICPSKINVREYVSKAFSQIIALYKQTHSKTTLNSINDIKDLNLILDIVDDLARAKGVELLDRTNLEFTVEKKYVDKLKTENLDEFKIKFTYRLLK